MPLVGVNCLRLAGRALLSPPELGGSEKGEVEGLDARVASNKEGRKTVLHRVPEIQVRGQEGIGYMLDGGVSTHTR